MAEEQAPMAKTSPDQGDPQEPDGTGPTDSQQPSGTSTTTASQQATPSSTPAASSSGVSQGASPSLPMTQQEKKARELFEQAEKKYKSSLTFFGGMFGGTTKKEEAADIFVRAANQYKVAKRPKAAGQAFKRAAEIHLELDTKHETASNLCEAAQVLKKEEPQDAVDCYTRAIEIYTDMGRFSLAARYHNNIGEICEAEIQDYERAIENYERAAEYFKGEDSVGSGNKCLLKVAHMCATMQNFSKAAAVFESIARTSLENTLLKYAAKDYFFKAAICHFCISPEAAQEAILRYKEIHPAFDGTRELKLIVDLLEAVDEEDQDKFSDIVKEYDNISRLEPWLTAQLLHIKKAIDSDEAIN